MKNKGAGENSGAYKIWPSPGARENSSACKNKLKIL
jgi:hypothetical protein